jgi:hypothetical protein
MYPLFLGGVLKKCLKFLRIAYLKKGYLCKKLEKCLKKDLQHTEMF